MKKTIELIDEQHAALVQVIQFLDSHRHSDEPVREVVDKILNHSDDLIRKSDEEIKQAREVLKRYEY
jgi:hemerythrin